MKKFRPVVFTGALVVFSFFVGFHSLAQNIQLHYDFGKAYDHGQRIERKYFTSTLEIFKIDSLGSTFCFVDVDFDKGNGGASLAYFELARKFTLNKKNGLGWQLEFNDGTPDYIIQAWLTGLCYPVRLGKFTLNTSLLYRTNRKAQGPDAQITLSWHHFLWHDKIFLNGFVDLWSQDNQAGSGKQLVLLAEPQFWYVISPHFNAGSEIEISHNFFTFDGDVEVMPTIAVRWVL